MVGPSLLVVALPHLDADFLAGKPCRTPRFLPPPWMLQRMPLGVGLDMARVFARVWQRLRRIQCAVAASKRMTPTAWQSEAQPGLPLGEECSPDCRGVAGGPAGSVPARTAGHCSPLGTPMNYVTPQELEYLRRHIREAIAMEAARPPEGQGHPAPSLLSRWGARSVRPPRRKGAS